MEFPKRFHVPRTLSALLILCVIGVPLDLLAGQLTEPAQRWATAIPQLADQLTQQVDDLTRRLSPDEAPVFIVQLLTAVTLTLFLLIFGSDLFVTWVKVFPRIEDKQRSILESCSFRILLGMLLFAGITAFYHPQA